MKPTRYSPPAHLIQRRNHVAAIFSESYFASGDTNVGSGPGTDARRRRHGGPSSQAGHAGTIHAGSKSKPSARLCLGGRIHHLADNGCVAGNPRVPDLRRKIIAESLLQRGDQRGANRGVIGRHDAVCHMPLAKRPDRSGDLVPLAQIHHRRPKHAHQLLALFRHVVLEHRTQTRFTPEQIVIEQQRRGIGDRRHFGEAGLYESLLLQCHGILQH